MSGNGPGLADFSKKATRKAVLENTMQYPLTLYPIGVGILGAFGAFLFGGNIITGLAMIGGFGVGVGTWAVNYLVRSETFANEYIVGLQKKIEEQNQKLLNNLEKSLAEFHELREAGTYGKQGANQFSKIQKKFNILSHILREKLNDGELTYRRYLGTAEQVYHSVLDNLQQIATTLKSASAIDVDYIEERISTLKAQSTMDKADEQEMETLQKRLTLREEQLKMVNELLTKNEQAMTELDKTTSALASVQTTKGRASMDLESALKDLEDLAKRADRISIKGK